MSGIRESVVVTSSREYVGFSFVPKKKKFTKNKGGVLHREAFVALRVCIL